MTIIEFNTQRLGFRLWQDRHRKPFVEMGLDSDVMKFFPSLISKEDTNTAIDAQIQKFTERGWGLWAVELLKTNEFIGFIGLSVPKVVFPFSPCVEIGWRLKRSAWGNGYATEGAKKCLSIGFENLALDEIVSFTSLMNLPSIAVMNRIGMTNSHKNFEHPNVPVGNPLKTHCLYKIKHTRWNEQQQIALQANS